MRCDEFAWWISYLKILWDVFFSRKRNKPSNFVQTLWHCLKPPTFTSREIKVELFIFFFDIMVTSTAEICCSEREKATQLGELATRKFIISEQKKIVIKLFAHFHDLLFIFFCSGQLLSMLNFPIGRKKLSSNFSPRCRERLQSDGARRHCHERDTRID